MAKKKSLLEAIDDSIGHKKERKKEPKKKKKPITYNQISNILCEVGDMANELDFLKQMLSDNPPELETHHLHGLEKILEHIHADSFKVMDLLEELEMQIR